MYKHDILIKVAFFKAPAYKQKFPLSEPGKGFFGKIKDRVTFRKTKNVGRVFHENQNLLKERNKLHLSGIGKGILVGGGLVGAGVLGKKLYDLYLKKKDEDSIQE